VSTVDLRVDYLRPGSPEDLVCEAEVVRMGNRVAVMRAHVYSGGLPEAGADVRPIATAQGVYNIVRRE
jgi:acyl-coenzyme A thioesterase PaaI-like protein